MFIWGLDEKNGGRKSHDTLPLGRKKRGHFLNFFYFFDFKKCFLQIKSFKIKGDEAM